VGIYTQGDGAGVTGGKGGEGLVSDYFMMRIGIPTHPVLNSASRHRGLPANTPATSPTSPSAEHPASLAHH